MIVWRSWCETASCGVDISMVMLVRTDTFVEQMLMDTNPTKNISRFEFNQLYSL